MNLIDGTEEDVRRFVVAVTGLAVRDFRNGGKQYAKTGKELVTEIGASQSRIFHRKMASGIYNNVIATMELMGDD